MALTKHIGRLAWAVILLTMADPARAAGLKYVGPADPVTTLPGWYADETGLTLTLCLDQNLSPANGSYCVLTPEFDPDPTVLEPNPADPAAFLPIATEAPISEANFPDETFYYSVAAAVPIQTADGADTANLEFAVEAAFLSGIVPQTGVTFLRINLQQIRGLAPNSIYTVTHPYGSFTFPTDGDGDASEQGGQAFRSEDLQGQWVDLGGPLIENFLPGVIRNATLTGIGPFLVPETGLVTDVATGNVYIGDFTTPVRVTGGLAGNNTVTVEGPDIGGPGIDTASTEFFVLSGRVVPWPGIPQGVTAALGEASGSADVSWTPGRGVDATSFTVRATSSTPGALTPVDQVVTGEPLEASVTVTGLTMGATYTFAVQGSNTAGTSVFSTSSSPLAIPLVAPGVPTAVTATAGVESASVSWTAADGTATSFTVRTASETAGATIPDDLVVAGSPPATSVVVPGLSAGATYTFTVLATNAQGPSAFSTPSNEVVPTAAPVARIRSDFDFDGHSDVLWKNGTDVYTWFMNGENYTFAFFGAPPDPWEVAATGDFDGDGFADVLWRNGTDMYIWFMHGTLPYTFAYVPAPPQPWAVLGAGDFNGDGTDDLLWRNGADAYVWYMGGTEGAFTFAYLAAPPEPWQVVAIGDFDGDADADLVWRNGADAYAWFMSADATFTFAYLAAPPEPWAVAGTGDFDGDGVNDLLWRNGPDLYVWFMNAGVFTSVYVAAPPEPWQLVQVGNFGGDARADLLWRNGSDLQAWFMNADGTYTGAAYAGPPEPWQVVNR
jgi:hypothetical protein